MKKFVAILLAVLTVLSATSMMVFAEDAATATFSSKCPYCLEEFKDATQAKADATRDTHMAICTKKPAVVKDYKCDYCDEMFESTAALKTHIEERFAVVGHFKACGNWTDKNLDGVKDEGECCTAVFTTKVAYDAHAAECKFKDTRSNADKMKDAFEAGNYVAAIKYLFKTIVEFVQSAEFKNVIDKISNFVKGINLDKVVASVKDVVAKIPFDKVGDLIKK